MYTVVKDLESSNYYTISVVSIPDVTQGNVYAVINKAHGVMEMSTSLITNAYDFFDELNAWSVSKYESEGELPEVEAGAFN